MLWVLLLLPLQASASDFEDRVSGMAEVTGVRVSSHSDKVRIVVDATKGVEFKKMVLSNPDRVVVDLPNAWLSPKAKKDLDYYSKIEEEHKKLYEDVRQEYSEYMDANHDVILNTVRQKQTDLENEMQLQYNAYSQTATQRLAAEAKVQEETPAFTTLQSATVPVRKTGPHRAKSALVFLFLAFMGTSAWILYKEGDLKQLLGLS